MKGWHPPQSNSRKRATEIPISPFSQLTTIGLINDSFNSKKEETRKRKNGYLTRNQVYLLHTMTSESSSQLYRGRGNHVVALYNRLVSSTVFVLLLTSLAVLKAADRPNIIVIMADDMGWSDIGCYGGEINTPNLDSLAKNGVRFTQFYNTSRCCPTRATLLTGLYAHQAGVGHMMSDRGFDSYRGDLSQNAVTIAEVMKLAGYRTYQSGKWHVSRFVAPEGPQHNWPRQRGFDRFFGTIHGAGSFYDPNSLTIDNTQIAPWDDFYYTEAINDFACRFIQDHEANHDEEPFFMYVAHTAPHWPMHARPEDIAKYHGKYAKGWDALRAERYERLMKMGLVDPSWKLAPRDPRSKPWKEADLKPWEQRCMEVYAAMVDKLDQGIGNIIKTLKETGEFDNTLILFLADNGACAENYGRQLNSEKTNPNPTLRQPMKPGELQARMEPRFTRDGLPIRTGRGVMPGPSDTYIAYGLSWANASNTPFREYKHWVHEGGISSPLIAHWPKGISKGVFGNRRRSNEGPLVDDPAHLIDLMATCVDLSEVEYPKEFAQHKIQPMEGISLAPAFKGTPLQRPNPIFWEHEGNRAIRKGDWKLVSKHKGEPELYHIPKDRTELNDLSSKMPDKVKELSQEWMQWATRAGVQPWPLPRPKK
jgi:arylsulfatase A-like enzyme